jgi:hypothetical protein
VEECPRCGIIVSKFSERKRVDADCRPLRTNLRVDPDARNRTAWITVVGSLILCFVLGVALLKWVGNNHRIEAKPSQGPGAVFTGLKKFTVDNLQEEVVAVSRNQPVLMEFYSSG